MWARVEPSETGEWEGGWHLEALGQETCRKTKMEDNWMGEEHGEEGEGIDQDGGQLDDGRSAWGGPGGCILRWRTIGWEEYLGRRESV